MKKLVGFLIAILLFSSTTAFAEAKSLQNSFDTTQIEKGVVAVQFVSAGDARKKVMIEKDSSRYIYNMTTEYEKFPLQLDNGTYKISLLENSTDNKYKVVAVNTVNMELANKNDVFLNSIQIINWTDSSKAVVKAKELTKDLKSDEEKVKAIYDYVTQNVTYDYNKISQLTPDYVPSIDSTFESNKGICYDYSSLFAGMLRSIGIPAKLVKGYAPNVKEYHAWNEVYLESLGKWVTVDTTVDSQLISAKKNVPMFKDNSLYKKASEY